MPSEKTVTKASETRRSTKPIMEKRRRARINNSLSELKNLILDALKKDNARHSKLEKADILEMTVKHLQNLQMQQVHPEPAMMAKFRAGYADCAAEVTRFMRQVEGVDQSIQQRLLNHLSNCLTGMNSPPPSPLPPVHVQVGATTESELNSTRLLSGVHLVPTRLPSGDIAFLLPAQLSVYAPSTVPISPASSRSSVSSPMSTTSSPSPVNVLGSSGILSPASSDRSSPSPHYIHHDMHVQHCPVIVPAMNHHKVENKNVWRPF